MSRGSSALRRSGRLACCASSRSTSGRSASFSVVAPLPERVERRARRATRISSIQRCTSSGRDRLRREVGECRCGWRARAASRRCAGRSAACSADRRPAPRFRRAARSPPAGAARRRSGRDRRWSRSRRRPGLRRSGGRRRARCACRPRPVRRCRAAPACSRSPRCRSGSGPISISGLMPSFQLAEDLDDVVVVDQRRGVRLLASRPRGCAPAAGTGCVREAAGRLEFEPQSLLAFLDDEGFAQVSQQQRDEIWSVAASSSVPSRAPWRTAAKRMRIVALAVEARPFDLQRQHIARA